MPGLMVDPNLLNLLKSLHPFLPERGRKAATLLHSLGELAGSEGAQTAMRHFYNLRSAGRAMPMEMSTQELESKSPFTLFLILILILLSSGSGGGFKSPPAPVNPEDGLPAAPPES